MFETKTLNLKIKANKKSFNKTLYLKIKANRKSFNMFYVFSRIILFNMLHWNQNVIRCQRCFCSLICGICFTIWSLSRTASYQLLLVTQYNMYDAKKKFLKC